MKDSAGIRVVFTPEEIRSRVCELAAAIDRETLTTGEVPVLVATLRGSLVFLADLVRALSDAHVDFLAVSTFDGEGSKPGRVRIVKDIDIDIAGRRVLVVENVVDTGFTLGYILAILRAREPASLAAVTLVDKKARRIIDVDLAHVGFEVGDDFLLGYGFDYDQVYRNIPGIVAVDDLDALVDDPLAFWEEASRAFPP